MSQITGPDVDSEFLRPSLHHGNPGGGRLRPPTPEPVIVEEEPKVLYLSDAPLRRLAPQPQRDVHGIPTLCLFQDHPTHPPGSGTPRLYMARYPSPDHLKFDTRSQRRSSGVTR